MILATQILFMGCGYGRSLLIICTTLAEVRGVVMGTRLFIRLTQRLELVMGVVMGGDLINSLDWHRG